MELTQPDMCEISGIPVSSQKKYEGDHAEPGGEALTRYAQAGVNLQYVATGQGRPARLKWRRGLSEEPMGNGQSLKVLSPWVVVVDMEDVERDEAIFEAVEAAVAAAQEELHTAYAAIDEWLERNKKMMPTAKKREAAMLLIEMVKASAGKAADDGDGLGEAPESATARSASTMRSLAQRLLKIAA
jgi:hypothetical protein